MFIVMKSHINTISCANVANVLNILTSLTLVDLLKLKCMDSSAPYALYFNLSN